MCGAALRRGQVSGQPSSPPTAAPRGCFPGCSEQQAQQHSTLTIARSQRCGAGGCLASPATAAPHSTNVPAWPLLTVGSSHQHSHLAVLSQESPSNAAAPQPKLQQCSQAGDTLCTGPWAVSVIQTQSTLQILERKSRVSVCSVRTIRN